MGARGKIRDAALALAFVALLAAPGAIAAAQGFPWDPMYELRSPNRFPAWRSTAFSDFPRAFEGWFADHFALRRELVRLSSRLRYAVGVSSADGAIVGRKGWLLFTGDYTIEHFRRTRNLDDGALEAWRSAIVRRRDWLAARGIHYLVVFHPNKESIYPEAVPRALTRLARPSATERMMESLAAEGVPVLDSTAEVLRLKKSGQDVYLKTDTHWNGLGVYAGYRAMALRLQQWFPVIQPMGFESLRTGYGHGDGGDLARMLALPDVIHEPANIWVGVARPRARRLDPGMTVPGGLPPHSLPFALETRDETLPRAVVLGDSFTLGIAPLLGEHFSRMLYYGRHEIAPEVIERERPDVVIDAWVERFLLLAPPETSAFRDGAPGDSEYAIPGMDEPHGPGLPFPEPRSWNLDELARNEDGQLVALGTYPAAFIRFEPFVATPSQSIWLELTMTTSAAEAGRKQAHLLWSAGGDPGFERTRSVAFPVQADGQPHRYRIRPSLSPAWKGEITGLRLQLPQRHKGAIYRLGAAERSP